MHTNLHDTQYFKIGTDTHDRDALELEDVRPVPLVLMSS